MEETYDITFISQPDADAELLEALGQFLLEDSQVDRMTSIAIRLHPAYVASAGAIPEGFRLPGVRVVNPQDESIYATPPSQRQSLALTPQRYLKHSTLTKLSIPLQMTLI